MNAQTDSRKRQPRALNVTHPSTKVSIYNQNINPIYPNIADSLVLIYDERSEQINKILQSPKV